MAQGTLFHVTLDGSKLMTIHTSVISSMDSYKSMLDARK